jgi:hypothetical protein
MASGRMSRQGGDDEAYPRKQLSKALGLTIPQSLLLRVDEMIA